MRALSKAFPCAEVTGVQVGGVWHQIATGSLRFEDYVFSTPEGDQAIRLPNEDGSEIHQAFRFVDTTGDVHFGPVSAIQCVRARAD